MEQTWIDGRRYFERDSDAAAQAWATAERQRLLVKALAERLKKPDPARPTGDKPPPDTRGVDTPPEPWPHYHDHDRSYRFLYHDGADGLSCALDGW